MWLMCTKDFSMDTGVIGFKEGEFYEVISITGDELRFKEDAVGVEHTMRISHLNESFCTSHITDKITPERKIILSQTTKQRIIDGTLFKQEYDSTYSEVIDDS